MKPPQTFLLAGLMICAIAVILIICKIDDNRKNRDDSSHTFTVDDTSSVEPNRLVDQDVPILSRRQRAARENLGVLSRLGYVLTADEVEDHKAKGKVHITAPDGRILKSDSMSISTDGENILLHGSVLVVSVSGFVQGRSGADAFARIALDGSSQTFVGAPLYEPGSTMMIVPKVQPELDLLPTR